MNDITEEDVTACWGPSLAVAFICEILNGQYSPDEAKRDLTSLIGTKYDGRVGGNHE